MGQAASVTETLVQTAAEELIAAGRQPTVRLVRERLGGGSMSTITTLLRRVRPLLPAPASMVIGPIQVRHVALALEPSVDAGKVAELEGRVAELRLQIDLLIAERDRAVAGLADAQAKAKVAKAEAAAAGRAQARAEEAAERERLGREAAEEQVRRINKLMIADAAHMARLRAYLEAHGGAATLAQAERGEAPSETDVLVAVAKAARAVEATDFKGKSRAKRSG